MTNQPTSPSVDGETLLPCPFCGSAPEQNAFGYYHAGTESREIRCVNKDCLVRPALVREQSEENDFDLIASWNTRPAPSSPALDPATVEALREPGFIKPDNDRQVFFYEQDFYVLSNFSAFSLRWAGDIFPTSEHVYHWEKFRHAVYEPFELQALAVRKEIKAAPSAHEAFKIAERNKNLRRSNWDEIKVNVMRNILIRKVEQHEYVARKLLATGERELIEDSWRDDFWGWGPNRDGKNMLGKLWMEIRSELPRALTGKDGA